MFDELVLQVFRVNATASCAAVELAGNAFRIPNWAVDGDYARCFTLVRKGYVAGV